jgi:GPH family glycoside/pentoside/hexuronide:cation symporter
MTGWLLNGIVTTIIVGVTMLIFIIWGAKEKEEFKLDHKHEFGYFTGLGRTFKAKGFVLYTIMFFLYEYILLLLATIVPLFGKHVLGTTNTFETSILMGLLYVVSIVTVFLWRIIDIKLGSKRGYIIAIILYILATIPFLWVSTYLMSIIVIIAMGFGFGGMLYFIYLIIADVIDHDELKTGKRREGNFFGVTNFFMRLSMIASIITISLMFTQTGWEDYIPNPGVDVVFGLRILFVIFPAIALVGTLICLYFYPFSKSVVAENKKKLEELHEQKLDRVRAENI